MKHVARRPANGQTTNTDPEPEELFSGQFVVFTVYALLELPATVSWSHKPLKHGLNSFLTRISIALIRHTDR